MVVDELSLFLRLGELVRDMEAVLARYGSRLSMTKFNEALLGAVDRRWLGQTASCRSSSIGCALLAALCSKANGGLQRMRTNSLSVASASSSAMSRR